MNPSHPINEDEFAERLEDLENAARGEASDIALPEFEDEAQQQKFDAAARVIEMIHRNRRAKAASAQQPAALDTDGGDVHAPTRASGDDDIESGFDGWKSIHVDGKIPARIGRFQIREKLGQGGYGLVFLAHDPQLNRDVALKIPQARALFNHSTRSRFIREAKAAASLNHANIIPVFEAGCVGPFFYITSAYCPGKPLGQWIDQQVNPVAPLVAAQWVSTLAEAVQHAHLRGIIHRDLKPDNILVEPTSLSELDDSPDATNAAATLRITDFGLAKDLKDPETLTHSGSVLGTPSFMSPEQSNPKLGKTTHLVDIYGLGAVLYFILCQTPPIPGESLHEVIRKIQEQSPISPRKIRPEIPRDLDAICLKCLEKNPQHRYQSASELQSDLLRFRDGLPVKARRPSGLDRVLMWCRRRPAITTLAGSLVLVLAISSIAFGILLARSNSLKKLSDAHAASAETSALEAKTASRKAKAERDRTREALHAMTSGVATHGLGSQAELTAEQKKFIEDTVSYFRQFAAGATDNPDDLLWVAKSEHRLSELLARLGQIPEAIDSAKRAVSLLEQIPSEWDPATVAMEQAETLHDLETFVFRTGKPDESLPIAEQAVEIARTLASDQGNDAAQILLSQTLGNLGSRLRQLHRFEESLIAQSESVLIKKQLVSDHPNDQSLKRSLGISLMNHGNLLTNMKKLETAREQLEQSHQIRLELAETNPDGANYQFDLALILGNLAALSVRMGEFEDAEEWMNQCIEIDRRLVNRYPLVERYRSHFVNSLSNLSVMCNNLRKFEASQHALSEMNLVAERSINDFPDVPRYRLHLAGGQSSLANLLSEQGQHQQAIKHHDAAVAQLREMISQSVEVSRATRLLEMALYNRATALGYVERHGDAIDDWDALARITQPDELNTVLLCRATSLVKTGKIDAALEEVKRVLEETARLPKDKQDFRFYYNSACVHSLVAARIDNPQKSREHAMLAIDLLQQACDAGLAPISIIKSDPELEPLHSYPEFQAMVEE